MALLRKRNRPNQPPSKADVDAKKTTKKNSVQLGNDAIKKAEKRTKKEWGGRIKSGTPSDVIVSAYRRRASIAGVHLFFISRRRLSKPVGRHIFPYSFYFLLIFFILGGEGTGGLVVGRGGMIRFPHFLVSLNRWFLRFTGKYRVLLGSHTDYCVGNGLCYRVSFSMYTRSRTCVIKIEPLKKNL